MTVMLNFAIDTLSLLILVPFVLSELGYKRNLIGS